ncbi:DinB family protein [Ktedonospora formicarum]|uniref:DinB-like domain-containing protein n=1 Tax=Ktedonospora formicarum TaxID=2778364 RepID=A0A8J3MRN2_9CHLR|nr:DinB family protein [Ktedonospora formicarum]GHO43961.1 hypothetical protein KSX_21240 [Ktedonospora formicarum]
MVVEEEQQHPFETVRGRLVSARVTFLGQLAKFNKDELAALFGKGTLSPLQIAYHLYMIEGLTLVQLRLVQAEENPLLEISEIEEQPTQASATPDSSTTLDAVMAGMAAQREELFSWLSTLPSEAWTRPFRHPRWGQLKFHQLVQSLIEHDQHHAQQLACLKK